MIKKIKGKFELYSKDGTKHLGSFDTKEEAQAREDEINKIKHAKEPTGNQLLVNISTLVDNSAIRTETIEGVEFTVLPSKTLPPDIVMNGIMYPADEVKRTIDTLNMTPVTLGHPVVNGKFADAYDMMSQAKHGLSGAFNKVTGQAQDGSWLVDKYIPTEALQNSTRGKVVANAIAKKQPIHTSTGVYLNRIPTIGVNSVGQEYDHVADIKCFNHDAILVGEIGAATPEQGVGIFVNADGEQEVEVMYCNLYEMEEDIEAECEMMPEEEKRPIIAFLSKMLAKLTRNPKHDTMDGESGDMPPMPMNNNHEGTQVEKQEAEKMIADALAVNASQLEESVKKICTDVCSQMMKTMQMNSEQAEKDSLIQQVVNAKLLPEEAAKECGITALRAMIANQKQPAFGLNANRAAGGNDEFAGYDFNAMMETK